MSEVKLETAPFDSRFPNTNQTKNCWQNYLDFHRCTKKKGDGHQMCEYFKRNYRSLCPEAWHTDWDDKREEGNFPGKI